MDDDRELHKELAALDKKYAVLEEQMKTMHARNEALKSDVNASLALLREDMAKRDTEAVRRDKDNLRWQIGLWVAAIVVIGVLIRWPGPGAGP